MKVLLVMPLPPFQCLYKQQAYCRKDIYALYSRIQWPIYTALFYIFIHAILQRTCFKWADKCNKEQPPTLLRAVIFYLSWQYFSYFIIQTLKWKCRFFLLQHCLFQKIWKKRNNPGFLMPKSKANITLCNC